MTILEETHWEKANKTKMGIYITDVETNFAFSSAKLVKGGLVVDLGAEAGRFSIPLAKNNVNVIAIDMSLHGLKRLRLKNRDVNTILADARATPLKDNLIDTVIMIEVLDYIPELKHMLTECWRILKHEGTLVFAFGNRSSFKGKLKKSSKQPYLHSYHNILWHLNSTGFRIVRKKGFNWLPFNRNSENPLIPLLAKIERLFGLRELISMSPWVMVHAIKSTKP